MALTNGTFETGDLTGWTDGSGGSGTATATVTAGAKQNGTYGLRLYASTSSGSQSAVPKVTQDISSDFTNLKISYKVEAKTGTAYYYKLEVKMSTHDYWVYVYYESPVSVGSWTLLDFDMAEIVALMDEGDYFDATTTLSINTQVFSSGAGTLEVFIDDVIVTYPAVEVANGDFETGDLTDWTNETTGSGTHSGTQTVTTGAKRSGTYGARLTASAQSEGYTFSSIMTVLPDSGWDYLRFFAKANSLVRNFAGYSELRLFAQMTVSATPTWVAIKTVGLSDITAWRPTLVLLDEFNAIRTYNSGTWIDNEIPFKISLYHYNEDSSTHDCDVYIDDVSIETIGAFSNGDFETNDLTGWDDDSYRYQNSSDEIDGSVSVATSGIEKHAGSYAAKMNVVFDESISDGANYAAIIRPLVVADFTAVDFWYKITDATGNNPKFQVQVYGYYASYGYCDWTTVFELSGGAEDFVAGSWIEVNITKEDMETLLTSGEAEFMDTTIMRFVSNSVHIPS